MPFVAASRVDTGPSHRPLLDVDSISAMISSLLLPSVIRMVAPS